MSIRKRARRRHAWALYRQAKLRSRRLAIRPLNIEHLESRTLLAGVPILLGNLAPGAASSFPHEAVRLDDEVFFGAKGSELWKTNGSPAGTVFLKDLGSRIADDGMFELSGSVGIIVHDDAGTFGDHTDDRVQVWKSNGTTAGTVLVSDFGLGSFFSLSASTYLVKLSTQAFFRMGTTATGIELWKTNLTTAGTSIVVDLNPGSGDGIRDSVHSPPAAFNSELFFEGNNGTTGFELWKTNGTTAGTVLIADIEDLNPAGSYPSSFAVSNAQLFFGVRDSGGNGIPFDGDDGVQLWKTNGTTAGTTLVKNFPLADSASSGDLVDVSGTIFGVVDLPATGPELWKSNGTSTGTVLVKDIRSGANGSYPYSLTNVNGTLFFSANDGVSGTELWMSNGTSAGTVLVADLFPGSTGGVPNSSSPYDIASFTGQAVFIANDGPNEEALWSSDGTGPGTERLTNLNPAGAESVTDFLPAENFGTLGNVIFFAANDGVVGVEPWMLPFSGIPDKIGVHRGSQFYLDVSNNHAWDGVAGGDALASFGNITDVAVVGDWNGDGIDDIGVRRASSFYLDLNGNGKWDGPGIDTVFNFGNATDVPVIGDWNDDGMDDVGVHRVDRFYLDTNGNRAWNTGVDGVFSFGIAGDQAVIGDWNADGIENLGVHRGDTWYLDLNANFVWNPGIDGVFQFGNTGDEPVIGDWNNDGVDDLGVHRGNQWFLDSNGNRTWNGGAVDTFFTFGNSGDDALAGHFGSFPFTANGVAAASSAQAILSADQVETSVSAAIDILSSKLALAPAQLQLLSSVQVVIGNLDDSRLAHYVYGTIVIDDDAAGFGWFVDATPLSDEEFAASASGQLQALDHQAADHMDLLTVVIHEMGHLLGLSHGDDELEAMYATLAAGVRLR